MLHPCFLLFAGTTTAILASGLVELPGEVEREGTTGRIEYCQLTRTIDDGLGLVGIEDVVATQIEGQRAETTQIEVALNAHIDTSLSLQDAEVVDVAFRIETDSSIDAPALWQFDGVVPADVHIRTVECDDRANSRALLAYP